MFPRIFVVFVLIASSLTGFAAQQVDVSALSALEIVKLRDETQGAYGLTGTARTEIALLHATGDGIPRNNAAASLASPEELAKASDSVASIAIDEGTILVTFSDKAPAHLRGQIMAVSPCVQPNAFQLQWACGNQFCPEGWGVPQKGRPAFERTTLPNDVLPSSCRGNGQEAVATRDKALAGDPAAQAFWAAILIGGTVVPADVPQALELSRSAAEAGNADGMYITALAYIDGVPDLLEPDTVEAFVWMSRAVSAGLEGATGERDALGASLNADQRKKAEALLTQ